MRSELALIIMKTVVASHKPDISHVEHRIVEFRLLFFAIRFRVDKRRRLSAK